MTTTDRDAKVQIAYAIEANGTATSDEYDLDVILRETHSFRMPEGYVQTASAEDFWASVERNGKTPTGAGAFHPR